jgi:hypothetical protein
MGCCHHETHHVQRGKEWEILDRCLRPSSQRFLTISTSRENKKPIDRSFREKNYKQMYEASYYPVEPHIKNPKL